MEQLVAELFDYKHIAHYIVEAQTPDYYPIQYGLNALPDNQIECRTVRGKKTCNTASLFNEFGAALQFPYSFKENWQNFYQCLTDLNWLGEKKNFVVIVLNAENMLSSENNEQMKQLLNSLDQAVNFWSEREISFRLLFQSEPDKIKSLQDRLYCSMLPIELIGHASFKLLSEHFLVKRQNLAG